MSKQLSWSLLAVWAMGLLVALLVYGQRQLSEFDPEGKLQYHSSSPQFDERLTAALKAQQIKSGSIIHIGTQQTCFCENLTEPHQTQLVEKFRSMAFELVKLDIEEIPELGRILSTVPALMIVDKQYRLRYVGPYATGYGCFTGKNLVEQVTGYAQLSPYQGAVIKADAVGCFC